MGDLAFMPALEQAALIRNKELSPVELVGEYARRIEELDPTINAYVTLVLDRALEQARDAEALVGAGEDLPPFHGVPIAIKDLTETAGIRTTYSTKSAADLVPDVDAYVVRRIKEAGFILLGKTNTPEFGFPPVTESELNGICRNPWDTDRTPGGSSGGAAAALAAGMMPVAHGSDGGGSVRIPASCCGLFGIKPARGRISMGPMLGEAAQGLATNGSLGRTVRDAAALLDVMSGYETGDPYWAPEPERSFADEVGTDPGRLRIGLTTETPNGVPVDPICVEAATDAARLLESLGHDVEEASPEMGEPDQVTASFITLFQSSASLWQQLLDLETVEPLTRALAENNAATSAIDYVNAVVSIHALSRKVVAFWDDYDLLLTPTLAMPPVPVGWIHEEEDPWGQLVRCGMFVPFTPAFNMTGQPAVSLPLFWSDDGLPIGVQLAGRPADEATLIRVSAQLEAARPWADRRPPLS
ncbi:MAG: amidase [Actinomycetota bacterium]|nr:amidase [Actinomycetota bacterium]